jgi:hypothetical protein
LFGENVALDKPEGIEEDYENLSVTTVESQTGYIHNKRKLFLLHRGLLRWVLCDRISWRKDFDVFLIINHFEVKKTNSNLRLRLII